MCKKKEKTIKKRKICFISHEFRHIYLSVITYTLNFERKYDMMNLNKNEVQSHWLDGMIYTIRGKKVMIDRDLAALYGVETKRLNEQVRRNIKRFPEDFMFQLSKEECLRSQIATLNTTQGKHLKYLPYAFTENGIAMLSSVLRSEVAIEVNIRIMRTQLDNCSGFRNL